MRHRLTVAARVLRPAPTPALEAQPHTEPILDMTEVPPAGDRLAATPAAEDLADRHPACEALANLFVDAALAVRLGTSARRAHGAANFREGRDCYAGAPTASREGGPERPAER